MYIKENESMGRLNIHAVPLVRYMGKGTDGSQRIEEEHDAEHACLVIPTQVR